MGDFWKVVLHSVGDEREEFVAALCFAHGASGVSENLLFQQPNLVYEAQIVETKTKNLEIFFDKEPRKELFEILNQENIKWEFSKEVSRDWLEEWKKGFNAFCLVGPYWVVPSWSSIPTAALRPLRIDPGMAFGTGTHATTRIASRLLLDLMQTNHPKSVLDVGTGTGILAMIAALEGADLVIGTEIDQDARRTARENIQLNGVSVEIPEFQIEQIPTTFDLVVANIIDGVLLSLKKQLDRLSSNWLILSGILIDHDGKFIPEMQVGYEVVRRLEDEEWVGYLLQKKQKTK